MRSSLLFVCISALAVTNADYFSDKRAYYCQAAYDSCLSVGNEQVVCGCQQATCLGDDDEQQQAYCASATATMTAIEPSVTDTNPFANVFNRKDVCTTTTFYGNTAFNPATETGAVPTGGLLSHGFLSATTTAPAAPTTSQTQAGTAPTPEAASASVSTPATGSSSSSGHAVSTSTSGSATSSIGTTASAAVSPTHTGAASRMEIGSALAAVLGLAAVLV